MVNSNNQTLMTANDRAKLCQMIYFLDNKNIDERIVILIGLQRSTRSN